MGCHTWFGRPLSLREISNLINSANENLEKRWKEEESYRISGIAEEGIPDDYYLTEEDYEFLKQQIKSKNLYVISEYGELGEYAPNVRVVDYYLFVDLTYSVNILTGKISEEEYKKRYNIPEFFHDNFRLYNYPRWTFYNTRALRRKLRDTWYSLTLREKDDIYRFFKLYPGGVIYFG